MHKLLRLTLTSVSCSLLLSFSTPSQCEAQVLVVTDRSKSSTYEPASAETQRRSFATSQLISLATDARSYSDLALRPRVLARAADALWEADNLTARALFARAWEAAEAADADDGMENVKAGKAGPVPAQVIGLRKMSGNDFRVDVLSLASRRDRSLGEQFLAKLKSEKTQEAAQSKNTNSSQNVFTGQEANLKRLLVANRLLAADEVAAAREFAGPALTEVNARSINFLSLLRAKEAVIADRIFADLMTRVEADPIADANTISGLSSYAFTPGFYIVFWADGHSTWTQPEESTVAPSLDLSLRARFFQVAANVLLRPAPPPDQDISSCGRRGRLMVITRLLPLFEQFAPETATALRAQLTAKEGRNIDSTQSLLSEGIRSEPNSGDVGMEEQLGRAKSTAERDQIYAAAATKLAVSGNKRAREFADSIDDSKLRPQVRNYVDLELIKFAIKRKNHVEITHLAGVGELTYIQRSWSYTQAARLLVESDRERSLELLQRASDEADRMDINDPDTSLALVSLANQFLEVDRARVWEILHRLVKAANSAEDFTGDDIRMPKRSMLVTRNGTRFINLPDADFNFSHLLRNLALDDLFRSLEIAKSFKYEGPRSYATLAIGKAVLEKPRTTTARN